MAAPPTTPTHPPPPSEATSTTNPPPPPPPPSGAESEATPKKRKVGFHHSPYYTIRETVANLRGRFLQVCQGTDSQKKDAAAEILKEMKDVMELSKKTRLGLSSAAEPVKPSVEPAARAPKDKPTGKIPFAETSQVPGLAENFVHNTGGDVPLKPDSSDTDAHRLPVETKKEGRPSKITECTKHEGEVLQGSYVIGGSPIGWNFLMWPGSKAVYYGLTKAEWLAHQSAK